jgi:hypothetical protein
MPVQHTAATGANRLAQDAARLIVTLDREILTPARLANRRGVSTETAPLVDRLGATLKPLAIDKPVE